MKRIPRFNWSRAGIWVSLLLGSGVIAGSGALAVDAGQACGTNLLINASFDNPARTSGWSSYTNAQVPGWTASSGRHEFWASGFQGFVADGANLSELNFNGRQTVHQDFATTPGEILDWSSWHRSRIGVDEMEVLIGSTTVQESVAAGQMPRTEWARWYGRYQVPAGQTTTRFALRSISGGGSGNLIDDINVSVSCDQTSPFWP